MTTAAGFGGSGQDGRRCPHDSKRLGGDETSREFTCDHCGYRERFGDDRPPLVTAGSAKSLVARYREMRKAGATLPARRMPGLGREWPQ